MTDITPGVPQSPAQFAGVAQKKQDAKPADSSVKSFEDLLEGPEDDSAELPRGSFARPRQGAEGQQADKQLQQGLAGQKTADGQQEADKQLQQGLAGQKLADGRQQAATNQNALGANAAGEQRADGLRSDAAVSQANLASTGAGVAGAHKVSGDDKKSPAEAVFQTQDLDGDKALSGLQQGAQVQSTQATAAAAVAAGSDARADDVAKLANTFFRELGARDLNSVKQGGALQFKLGGDAFPGTSVKVSVEAGLTVIDISSIEPDVQLFLKESQAELNRFFDAGVSVRVEERDDQSEQQPEQQQQDELEDQEENE